MPRLSRKLVEHWLSIRERYKPHKQPAKRFNPKLLSKIKGEIERPLKARFVNWLSNIVSVVKKMGKLEFV